MADPDLNREIILYLDRATGCGIATLVYERHLSPGVCTSCSHLHVALLFLAAQASDAIPPWCPAPQFINLETHGSSLCMGLRGRRYESQRANLANILAGSGH